MKMCLCALFYFLIATAYLFMIINYGNYAARIRSMNFTNEIPQCYMIEVILEEVC